MSKQKNRPSEYNEIGGWLILLYLSLILFTPIATIISLYKGYISTNLLFEQFPGLQIIFFVEVFIGVALAVLAIRAGLALYNLKKGAVKITKRLLLLVLVCRIIEPFLLFLAGLPSEVNEEMIPIVIAQIIMAIISFSIWYLYLSFSKRVKATYRDIKAEDSIVKPEKNLIIEQNIDNNQVVKDLADMIEKKQFYNEPSVPETPTQKPLIEADPISKTWVIEGKPFTIYKRDNGLHFIPFSDGQDDTGILRDYIDINHFEISPVFVEEPIPNVPDFAKVRSIKRLIGVNIIRKPSSE